MPARTTLHLSEKLVFRKLPEDSVFGNPASHCAGLLTFEHQGCPEFEREFSRFGLPKSKQEEGRNAIAHYRGQMSEVARRLQIGRSTLYRKLEVLGLTGSERREPEPKGENVAGERQPSKIVGIGAS